VAELPGAARQQLIGWISRLADQHVLVVGDLFLDEYILGHATRLSREAPIPVLELMRRFYVPGGAANPAHNMRALGARTTTVGVIGQDKAGVQLLTELQRVGIDTSGVVVDSTRPTTTKTRIMAESSLRFPQQLARIDYLDRRPLDANVEAQLTSRIEDLLPSVDAVLVSDYQTGVAGQALVQALLGNARAQGKLCTVDAQGALHKYKDFDLLKGNRQEVESALNVHLETEDDFQRAGEQLTRDLGLQAMLITRGAEGLSLIERGGLHSHLPAANRTDVFDVTGAGDTVIAVATLALLAGANALAAAQLANYAAGLVVRKLGNAVVSAEELRRAVENG